MPRGPKGEKRPADVIGNAVHVMKIATGEIEEELPERRQGQGRAGAGPQGRQGAGREHDAGAAGGDRQKAAEKRWRITASSS